MPVLNELAHTMKNMSIEDFRLWCAAHGVRFSTDPDTNSVYTTQSDEDMLDFALAVLESFGNQSEE